MATAALWLPVIVFVVSYSWFFTGYGVYRAWALGKARGFDDGVAGIVCVAVGVVLLFGLVYPFSLVVIGRWLLQRTKPGLQATH